MSSAGSGDHAFDDDPARRIAAAKERDLQPLLEEGMEVLGFDAEQALALEDYLTLAWASGTRSGRDQMEARAKEKEPDLAAITVRRFEREFKDLMMESAERMNLPVAETITMWGLLHRAWVSGNRTCEEEMMRIYVELNSDIPEEARRWLEQQDD